MCSFQFPQKKVTRRLDWMSQRAKIQKVPNLRLVQYWKNVTANGKRNKAKTGSASRKDLLTQTHTHTHHTENALKCCKKATRKMQVNQSFEESETGRHAGRAVLFCNIKLRVQTQTGRFRPEIITTNNCNNIELSKQPCGTTTTDPPLKITSPDETHLPTLLPLVPMTPPLPTTPQPPLWHAEWSTLPQPLTTPNSLPPAPTTTKTPSGTANNARWNCSDCNRCKRPNITRKGRGGNASSSWSLA